ncbi:MAG: hypothetical protein ACT6FF_08415 [Methanosarcinaceae archaeon]
MLKFIGDEDRDIFEIHNECKLDNFKSEVRDLIKRLFPRKGVSKFPDKIDYDMVFKNHAALMRGYGTVLKKDAKTFDIFIFRTVFVQSHIYKKLRSLRTIYIVEIATLYDTWKGSHHRVPIHLEYGGFTPSGTLDNTGCFHDTFFGEVSSWNIHPKRKNE